MARLVYGDLDLVGNLLKNFRVDTLAVEPTGVEGRLYFNSADDTLYVHDGTAWDALADAAALEAVAADLATETAARIAEDELKADKITEVIAGNGMTGGGTLALDVTLGVDQAWLVTQIQNNSANNLAAGNGIAIAAGALSTDPDTLSVVADPAAGNSLVVSATGLFVATPGAAAVTEILPTAGETTVVNTTGSHVVGLDDAITTAITANTTAISNESTARAAADTALQGEIDAETTARTTADDTLTTNLATEVTNRTNADAALTTRIDGISVVGTGAATVTEDTADHFTVHVDTLSLSNTYTGTTGVDSATINTEIAPELAEAGDLYINTATGLSFISTGDSADADSDADWVQLATPPGYVTSVVAGDASITVTNSSGPIVTLALSAALQTEITTATTANAAQDTAITALQNADTVINGRLGPLEANDIAQDASIAAIEGVNATQGTDIAALQADSHVAATAGNAAIGVVGQAISVVTDPASTELTVGAAGLTVDLSAYAQVGTDLHPAATGVNAIAVDSDATQVVSLVIDATSTTGVATQSAAGLLINTGQYATTAALGTETTARTDADTALGAEIDAIDAAYKTADALKADKTTAFTAGAGLSGGGDLSAPRSFDVGQGTGITVASDTVGVDVPWLSTQIANNSLQAAEVIGGNGIVTTPDGVTGTVSVAAVAKAAGGIVVDSAGIAIDPAFASGSAPIQSVTGTAGEITVSAAPNPVVGIDPAYTTATNTAITSGDAAVQADVDAIDVAYKAADAALTTQVNGIDTAYKAADTTLQGNITAEATARGNADTTLQGNIDAEAATRGAADTALGARIDGISIVGTGMATATEAGDNQWTVNVPSIQLANTYTGTGTDSTSINADLADNTPAAAGQAGDLYINSDTGQAFINTGLVAPDDWVELSSAAVGIDSIAAGSGVEVANGAGPVATVSVAAATLTEIATATSTNTAQDGRLDALEADTHVPAVAGAGGAIAVDGASQAVSLVLDPAGSDELTQSAAGLAVDLSAYAKSSDVTGGNDALAASKADKLTMINAGVGLTGGGNLSGDVTIDVAAGVGLEADASGIWVNAGAAIDTDTVNGVSVKYADGLTLGGTDTDSLVVQAVPGGGISVGAGGISVDTSFLSAGSRYATTLTAPEAAGVPNIITHELGTDDVIVSIYVGGQEVWADVTVGGGVVNITATPALPADTRVVVLV